MIGSSIDQALRVLASALWPVALGAIVLIGISLARAVYDRRDEYVWVTHEQPDGQLRAYGKMRPQAVGRLARRLVREATPGTLVIRPYPVRSPHA